MKCKACDYEYESGQENGKDIIKKGDKGRFIKVRIKAHSFIIDSESWEDDIETKIYACPNCGTIRLNDYDLSGVIDQREQKLKRERK